MAGLILILIGFLQGKKIAKGILYGVILILIGILILFNTIEEKADGRLTSITGDAYSFLSASLFAFMLLTSENLLMRIPPFTLFFF